MDPASPQTPLQPYTPPVGGVPAAPLGQAPLSPLQPAIGQGLPGDLQAAPVNPAFTPQAGMPDPAVAPGQPFLNSPTPPPMQGPMPATAPQTQSGLPAFDMSTLGPNFANSPQAAPQGVASPMDTQLPPANAEQGPANVKTELLEKLRTANNVLVTVSSNPSVDQLAAAIGITLILNRLDKHATAVFSGETPSTLEFLQPEKTIEKNTDSLRDFIIALDKAKADKLRYKVEDKFVKIFITPYHTSLSESDLEFSQGDFNVDVVLALGVHGKDELDQSITAHGRILHDAVTVSVNNKQTSDLGVINWFQADASSLCEMLVSLVEPLQGDKVLLDEQIATAFLTGVVAETERFSNAKTTPYTMNIAATLMKAGANQQLVSSKLEVQQQEVPHDTGFDKGKLDELAKEHPGAVAPAPTVAKDGSLAIDHKKEDEKENKPGGKTLAELEKENHENHDDDGDSDLAKIHIDEEGKLVPAGSASAASAAAVSTGMVMQPPSMGGAMSSVMQPETDGASLPAVDTPATDTVQAASQSEVLEHGRTIAPLSEEEKAGTLAQIEQAVDSPHVDGVDEVPSADAAREAVAQVAAQAEPQRLEPIEALNAQPVDLEKAPPAPGLTNEEVFPPQVVGPDQGLPADPTAAPVDPTAPPPVPPPMMPLQ